MSNMFQEEWISIVTRLEVGKVCSPQYYLNGIMEKAAQEEGYDASVYARVTMNDKTSLILVMSK